MDIINGLLANKCLLCALLAWTVAQGLKIFTLGIKNHHWSIRNFIGSGGMPSSHTAGVVALTIMVGWQQGFASEVFAACLVFSCIVMYDAAGVRRETGRQGKVINELLSSQTAEEKGERDKDLKERIGHSPLEVLMGALVGVLCAAVFILFFPGGAA